MARTSFTSAAASIMVCSDGYFDVYAPGNRTGGERPAYRGELAELGAGIRNADMRLAVRPDSVALADAVELWASVHGAAAVRGELGKGRNGSVAA